MSRQGKVLAQKRKEELLRAYYSEEWEVAKTYLQNDLHRTVESDKRLKKVQTETQSSRSSKGKLSPDDSQRKDFAFWLYDKVSRRRRDSCTNHGQIMDTGDRV